jgi:hypothetical protein
METKADPDMVEKKKFSGIDPGSSSPGQSACIVSYPGHYNEISTTCF